MIQSSSLLLDGRAFSLQTKGGVSQIWTKILTSKSFQTNFHLNIFLYPGYINNIHLAESGLLENEQVNKIYSDIPPSDNFNYADKSSIEHRRMLAITGLRNRIPAIVVNSYYGENILPECKRYMVVVHDFAHEDLPTLKKKPTTKDVIRRKVDSMDTATDLVFISVFTRTRALQLYPNIGNKNSNVIYHGHDYVEHEPTKIHGKFIHIGTRGSYKNFNTVAKAFTGQLAKNSSITLAIVGGELEDKSVKSLVDAYPDRVKFITDVSDAEISAQISSAQALVSASEYEGFGIPILNALHRGTQLILSDIPPYREVASHFASYFSPKQPDELEKHIELTASTPADLVPTANRPWDRVGQDYTNFILGVE